MTGIKVLSKQNTLLSLSDMLINSSEKVTAEKKSMR